MKGHFWFVNVDSMSQKTWIWFSDSMVWLWVRRLTSLSMEPDNLIDVALPRSQVLRFTYRNAAWIAFTSPFARHEAWDPPILNMKSLYRSSKEGKPSGTGFDPNFAENQLRSLWCTVWGNPQSTEEYEIACPLLRSSFETATFYGCVQDLG